MIEVLVSVPEEGRRRIQTVTRAPTGLSQHSQEQREKGLTQIPERVRINSQPLLKLLDKITGGSAGLSEMNEPPNPRRGELRESTSSTSVSLVFLRPFKLFVEYEEAIRQYAAHIAHKAHEIAREASNDKAEDEKEEEKEEKLAYCHLALLIHLFDTGLKYVFDLRKRVAEGKLEDIAFVDLWHLFSRKQEVIRNGNTATQILRVLHFSGGRPLLDRSSLRRRRRSYEPIDVIPPRSISPPRRRRRRRLYDESSTDYDSEDDTAIGENRNLPGLERFRNFSSFQLQCYNIDYNGTDFGPVERFFTIQPYFGKLPVRGFSVYPIQFHESLLAEQSSYTLEQFQADLISRGKKFLKVCMPSHRHCTGDTLDSRKESIDSPVMVDFSTAIRKKFAGPKFRISQAKTNDSETKELSSWKKPKDGDYLPEDCYMPGCCGNDYIHYDNDLDKSSTNKFIIEQEELLVTFQDTSMMQDSDLMLLPPRVYAFVFRDRRWARVHIDSLKPVRQLETGLDALYLPEGHQETLLALVRDHSRASTKEESDMQYDLIPGKGRGLIVLLHGPPGVGKVRIHLTLIAILTKHRLPPLKQLPITLAGLCSQSHVEISESLPTM